MNNCIFFNTLSIFSFSLGFMSEAQSWVTRGNNYSLAFIFCEFIMRVFLICILFTLFGYGEI